MPSRSLFWIAALTTAIPIGVMGQTSAPAASANPELDAKIVSIKGRQVTIANLAGEKRTLTLSTVTGLKPGQRTSWCEEDCRLLTVAQEYRVTSTTRPKR